MRIHRSNLQRLHHHVDARLGTPEELGHELSAIDVDGLSGHEVGVR